MSLYYYKRERKEETPARESVRSKAILVGLALNRVDEVFVIPSFHKNNKKEHITCTQTERKNRGFVLRETVKR